VTMRFMDTKIVGPRLIDPTPHQDLRGRFMRVWCVREFAEEGLGLLHHNDRILVRRAMMLPYANVIFDLDRSTALTSESPTAADMEIGATCGPTNPSRAGNKPRNGRFVQPRTAAP